MGYGHGLGQLRGGFSILLAFASFFLPITYADRWPQLPLGFGGSALFSDAALGLRLGTSGLVNTTHWLLFSGDPIEDRGEGSTGEPDGQEYALD